MLRQRKELKLKKQTGRYWPLQGVWQEGIPGGEPFLAFGEGKMDWTWTSTGERGMPLHDESCTDGRRVHNPFEPSLHEPLHDLSPLSVHAHVMYELARWRRTRSAAEQRPKCEANDSSLKKIGNGPSDKTMDWTSTSSTSERGMPLHDESFTDGRRVHNPFEPSLHEPLHDLSPLTVHAHVMYELARWRRTRSAAEQRPKCEANDSSLKKKGFGAELCGLAFGLGGAVVLPFGDVAFCSWEGKLGEV